MPCIAGNTKIRDLHCAIAMGLEDMVDDLLAEESFDINDNIRGCTALSLALFKDKTSIFEKILKYNFRKNCLNVNGISVDHLSRVESPLLTAIRLGQLDAVRLLIDRKANIECFNEYSQSALWSTCNYYRLDILKLLLANGADVNICYLNKEKPLMFCLKNPRCRLDIFKVLLYNGAHIYTKWNVTPILYHIVEDDQLSEQIQHFSFKKDVTQNSDTDSQVSIQEDCSLYFRYHKNPPTLLEFSRLMIRSYLSSLYEGKYFLYHLGKLKLPIHVMNFLALSKEAWCSLL